MTRRWHVPLIICSFIGILIVSLFGDITRLDYPKFDQDPLFDYLVARNAMLYNEYPLVVETQATFHSPLYIYFLATLLHIQDSMMTLSIASIVLHGLSISLLFIITCMIVGPTTGLLAMALFSYLTISLHHALYAYPPFIMHPFFLVSVLLLLGGHTLQKEKLVYGSIVFFILSASIHISAYPLFPIVLGAIYLVTKHMNRAIRINTIWVALITLLICNIPTILSIASFRDDIVRPNTLVANLSMFSSNIATNAYFFWIYFIYNPLHNLFVSKLPFIITSVIMFVGCIAILSTSKHKREKQIVWVLLCLIPLPILSISLTNVIVGDYHFTPLIGPLCIIGAMSLTRVFSWIGLRLPLTAVAIVFLLWRIAFAYSHPVSFMHTVETASDAAMSELSQIKKQHQYASWNFFQTVTLYRIPSDRVDPSRSLVPNANVTRIQEDWLLWPLLIHKLQGRFFINRANSSYPKATSSDDFIMLTCYHTWPFSAATTPSTCSDSFIQLKPEYRFLSTIHANADFSLLLFQKNKTP
jgi:hypothetical protein